MELTDWDVAAIKEHKEIYKECVITSSLGDGHNPPYVMYRPNAFSSVKRAVIKCTPELLSRINEI